jgi:ribonuclease HII
MIIAGLDEVGRGAFAGPLVTAAVVMGKEKKPVNIRIDDSKKLTASQRLVAARWIRSTALAWGIGKASSKYIDKFGLTKAENFAFRQAVRNAERKGKFRIDELIIDAFFVPHLRGIPKKKQFAIKGADRKSQSVASASIIAKVYRDQLMINLAKNPRYKKYKWDQNKGYGTLAHRQVIAQYGLSVYHRKLFTKR